jgi:hypothetical protein
MLFVKESEATKKFKQCVTDISDDDVATVSAAVYGCLELFKLQYATIDNWKNTPAKQTEWFACLALLAKDILLKEIEHELPFGTTNGVYMTLLFFKAIAQNENAQTISTMYKYLEAFNKIGYQISNNRDGLANLFNDKNINTQVEARLH